MPGVDDVNPLYTNDFENGAQLSLVVVCRDGNESPKPQGPQGNQTSEAAELQRQLDSEFSDCR